MLKGNSVDPDQLASSLFPIDLISQVSCYFQKSLYILFHYISYEAICLSVLSGKCIFF